MRGMVILANYVEQHELFLKNSVGKLFRHLHPPSKPSCESVLIYK